jgi:hypothetical protein
MKLVFCNILAGVASKWHTRVAYSEVHIVESIVAHKSSAMSGYPYKAIAIAVYVINEVAWQSG